MQKTAWILVAASGLMIAGSAIAQTAAAPQPPAQAAAKDPMNQVVCEKQEVVGSRLATSRVCHTRAEWADLRMQDRQTTERVQTLRGDATSH